MLVCWREEKLNIMECSAQIYRNNSEILILNGNCYNENYTKLGVKQVYDLIHRENNRIIKTSNLTGIYSVIYYDGINIYFYNDWMNLARLYYYFDEAQLIISDRVDSIVNVIDKRLTIDFTAWSEFVCFYYVYGNRTFFNEIKQLYLGEAIKFEAKNKKLISFTEDINLSTINQNDSMQYEEAIEKSAELLSESIRRIFMATEGKKKIITLSGGWDSRVIALISAQINKEEVETYTAYIDSGNDKEERYAKLVANYLGIHNQFFDLDSDYFLKELDSYTKDTDYLSTMHIPFWNFYKKFQEKEGVVLDGLLGDLFFRGMALPAPEAECGSDEYYNQCFLKVKLGRPEIFASRAMKEGIPFMARKGMIEEIERCNYNLRFFVMANRARSIGFTAYKQNENREVFLPFLDKELVKFALTIPNKYIFDKYFYPNIMEKVGGGGYN